MSTELNRRAILAGAAVLPAAALPAVDGEPDPIFAAIEAHRRTYELYGVAIAREKELCAADFERETDEASAREEQAEIGLVATRPTTLVGVVALLRYSNEVRCSGYEWLDELLQEGWSWEMSMCQSVADAIEEIARGLPRA
jgi:hypothetical protein